MTNPGCTCAPRYRRWTDNGTCSSCGHVVREVQIMDAVKAVLISDPRCLIWRNEIGHSTHLPDGTKRQGPIKYGLCNPGGADLIGLYAGRFLAVECKTVKGRQSPEQVRFQAAITAKGGVYALVRSEDDARELLTQLQQQHL